MLDKNTDHDRLKAAITFELTEEMHAKIEDLANRLDLSVSEVVEKILQGFNES